MKNVINRALAAEKCLLILMAIAIAMIGCQNQSEQGSDTHMVKVTIDFQDQLPVGLRYISVTLDSAKVEGGMYFEDLHLFVYPEDFINGNAVLYLNTKPKYYEMPAIEGLYNLVLLTNSKSYVSKRIPEMDIKEIDKYTELNYKLVQCDGDVDISFGGYAIYELVSSKKR